MECRCLWSDCYATFDDFALLRSHFEWHIGLLSGSNIFLGMCSAVLCPVSGCEHPLDSFDALLRHLTMHVFHAERQRTGLRVIMNNPDMAHLNICGFPPSSRIIHDGSILRCEWGDCAMLFESVLAYVDHVHIHIDVLGSQDRDLRLQHHCEWRGCAQKFKNKANLRVHVRHHTGDKAAACPFCGTFFSNNTKFFLHLLRKFSSNNQFDANNSSDLICKLCRKHFDSERLLREHCHRHIMNYKCNYCAVTVSSPSSLTRHIFTVHTRKRDYHCEKCSQKFAQKADLEKHSAIHSTELEFVCETCGEKFRWRKQLLTHARKHEKDYTLHTHLCHLCDAKYANGYGLSRHLMKKHNCQVPEGFTRFQYKKCADGFARLQTKKCLSKSLALKVGTAHDDSNYVTV